MDPRKKKKKVKDEDIWDDDEDISEYEDADDYDNRREDHY